AFEIVADNVHFAEPKRSENSSGSNKNAYPTKDESPDISADEPSDTPTGDTGDFEEISTDDDLPF
ncbi:MAG TPA: single-stranded DNA-binding protein, partial [Ruminococcaceae bacterium]|nr:single-stranded DNA-binding protein [Oscillospiraceae bacterium]